MSIYYFLSPPTITNLPKGNPHKTEHFVMQFSSLYCPEPMGTININSVFLATS